MPLVRSLQGLGGQGTSQEPAACEKMLHRGGDVLELVQGQLGGSQRQLLK